MKTEAAREFETLLQEAVRQVQMDPSADQVIVVKTAKANTYHFANHRPGESCEDEDRFVEMLSSQRDAEIRYLVCMWNNYGIEIPSMNFRKKLLAACGKNAEADILLEAEHGLIARKLIWSMPG